MDRRPHAAPGKYGSHSHELSCLLRRTRSRNSKRYNLEVRFNSILLLLVLAGGTAGVAAYWSATEESRAWKRLLSLQGRVIEMGPPDTKADARALFRRFSSCSDGEEPWSVSRIDPEEPGERLVLILRARDDDGFSYLFRAAVHAGDRRKLSESTFRSGTCTFPEGASVIRRPGEKRAFLRLDSPGSRSIKAQCYAVEEGNLVLVRMEKYGGKPHRNQYDYRASPAGPVPPPRPPEDWERQLASGSTPAVLAALTYLGGVHLKPGEDVDDPELEPEEHRRAVAAARAHPELRSRVMGLRGSPDPWIREAAEAFPLDGER